LPERREQLELLSRTLDREAHILMREPQVLPSHLHNMLYLDEGAEGPAGPLLTRAREALARRPWLRLANRPPVKRSALIRILEHGAGIEAIAWSPDGRLLASSGADHVVRLWDPTTGKPMAALKGHARGVEALVWSPDGALLASGSDDGTVRLWVAASAKCLLLVHCLASIATTDRRR
jgi:WD40 repeat protein